MARRSPSECAAGEWLAVGVCALMLGGVTLAAQEQKQVVDDSVPTLHAYTNLVQIPVLALGYDSEPVASIAPERFYVSLDGGLRFRVTHARLEGDDPISLAILLDVSEPFPRLEQKMDSALAGLAPEFLHSTDRVSIYAMNCDLERTAEGMVANPVALQRATASVLQAWRERGRVRWSKSCTKPSNLWDSLEIVAQRMKEQTGRRAILVVTDGVDRGSKVSWNTLRLYAQTNGVAIFGLTGAAYRVGGFSMSDGRADDVFRSMCELTGGLMLSADPNELTKQLEWFTTLLRSRYIVEFPHAIDTKGGYHDMQITIEKSDAQILAAGASMPVDNPAGLKDPTRIQSDPANAPQLGKRKVIVPQ
jgi:hypothetical protein